MSNLARRIAPAFVLAAALAPTLSSGGAFAAAVTDQARPENRRNYDALAARAAGRTPLAAPRAGVDPSLLRPGAPVHVHSALGVPTFLWAAPGGAAPGAAGRHALAAAGPEQAAREILGRYAPAYGLDETAVSRA